MRKIKLIGSAIGNCGRLNGCESSPYQVSNKLANTEGILIDSDVVAYDGGSHDILAQREFFTSVARRAERATEKGVFPIFIGGDHSCAIGSWSGVAENLHKYDQDLALIWIDAHMDAHRPETSETGNLHGMPVAHLLGHGHRELTSIMSAHPKLKPENLVYFGIRSYEKPEEDFLKSLGIKVYYQEMLSDENFVELFLQEYDRLAKQTKGNVGISLDLDGLDPKELIAVGTPVDNGISSAKFDEAMEKINIKHLAGFEIAEYNPSLDKDGSSIKYMMNLIKLLIGRIKYDN
ncbi:MAG: arginase [Neisseriaceae bacterium]|jgi:arginase|nr:MAG: arginase [Neisseriaceae bacterium]